MHEMQVTVRFCETDALGHVNNTSYFIYLEEARVKYFETLGYSMDVKKWSFILASTKCDFLSQGYFNQILTVKTRVSRIGTKSFQLDHEIVCTQTGDLIAKGSAVIVYFDFGKQESAVIPDLLREGLNQNLRET
ncbi:acyl-CoA thioesterase [Bacillus sp. CMF12]|uniref:acyl-CoA thioesterase n=1 Tax=Bacillaceae TaxID=186817 RepID=UPI001FB2D194|nr:MULTISPECIES: thioesterase family protein [Bacillaceae]UOE53180.1 acyl-CoA thioesterase [Cytobacillus oceanisediminis]USK47627.1 acyl-CoA thioesterase [Bacillus sp. CMF12]